MSLILDTLRRRKRPLDERTGPPQQEGQSPAGPAEGDARRSFRSIGRLVIYILFLIILGVSGWVLIEWLVLAL